MATSNTYLFDATRDQIITSALRKVSAIAEDQTPSTGQITNATFILNTIIKEAEADGMPLWAILDLAIPMTSFVNGSISLGIGQIINVAAPLKVITAVLSRNNSSNLVNQYDINQTIITHDEYQNITNKFSPGTPTQVFYQPGISSGVLKIWPIGGAGTTVYDNMVITYQRPFQDAGDADSTLDFPSYWQNAMVYALAWRLAPEYGVPVQDRSQLSQEANLFWAKALSFGTEEGSLRIEPDYSRSGQRQGNWG